MSFAAKQEEYRANCEAALAAVADTLFMPGSVISQAARYSVLGGGKRVRGVLVQAICEMLGGSAKDAAYFAAALEMVHAFSLIHDDLPCMDDDDLRRGKPACHIAFGEATALLAGDMLALQAFGALMLAPTDAAFKCEAAAALSAASGARGMIYGQELDLDSENKTINEAALRNIHKHKTGALFHCAAQLGIAAAQKPEAEHEAALTYADTIGLVFQIVDDILDVTATQQELGKPIGSDSEQGKNTFITLKGLEASREEATALTAAAIEALQIKYGERAGFLVDFANNLAQRVY